MCLHMTYDIALSLRYYCEDYTLHSRRTYTEVQDCRNNSSVANFGGEGRPYCNSSFRYIS